MARVLSLFGVACSDFLRFENDIFVLADFIAFDLIAGFHRFAGVAIDKGPPHAVTGAIG